MNPLRPPPDDSPETLRRWWMMHARLGTLCLVLSSALSLWCFYNGRTWLGWINFIMVVALSRNVLRAVEHIRTL